MSLIIDTFHALAVGEKFILTNIVIFYLFVRRNFWIRGDSTPNYVNLDWDTIPLP
jgi:hypothetical protein